ncbi:MAG: hypothetical protein JWP01_2237 [Myxococcales bacterium]|nr:hypothetical protein [Myxococcales bacterium]
MPGMQFRCVGFAVSAVLVFACRGDNPPSAAEITDRAWTAHALVIAAGERAKTCAEAGTAMQRAFGDHRQAFVDAIALDQDRAKLAEATRYIEDHESRYADLETRMEALSERCATDATVQAAFQQMSNP